MFLQDVLCRSVLALWLSLAFAKHISFMFKFTYAIRSVCRQYIIFRSNQNIKSDYFNRRQKRLFRLEQNQTVLKPKTCSNILV